MSTPNSTDLEVNYADSCVEASSSKFLASSGAPDEKVSPLGKEVTLLSAVMLNVGQITGHPALNIQCRA
ncbi:hypothetical protein H0H93_000984 [Arthromyces matolae]|nr:hypothetical protein H0H93_000984 [Arthromyces matolae]